MIQKVDLRLLSTYYAEEALNAKNEAERVMYLRHAIEGIETLIKTKEILEGTI